MDIDKIKHKLEKYCIYQDRCHLEVKKKIKEFTKDEDTINSILEYLIKNQFLNEERFSKSFVRGKVNIKKWGKNKIIKELKIKEISNTNIQNSLKEIDKNIYLKNLNSLYSFKVNTVSGNDFEKKIKIKRYLYNKGYEQSLIDDLIND